MSEPKKIEDFLPQITKTLVFCEEKVLTEYLHSPKYLDEYYIKEEEFKELVGLAHNEFYAWKKQGKFNKAMYPATIGGKRIRYHRWFNVYKQKIELPSQPEPTAEKLIPKDIETILPEIMKTFVFCVESILTEYLRSPKYLDEYYINEEEFRKLIRSKEFYAWKKQGKFNKAMYPIKLDSDESFKYHRWFNHNANKIKLPGLDRPPIKKPN